MPDPNRDQTPLSGAEREINSQYRKKGFCKYSPGLTCTSAVKVSVSSMVVPGGY